MTREKYQELIEERIDEMQPGNVFITSDFADIAPTAATNMSLSRLKKIGKIRRILRGIYDKPRFSRLLNEKLPVVGDEPMIGSCHHYVTENEVCIRLRNLSAIGENIWYRFHTMNSFVSSLGVSGRNTSPLSEDVSTSRSNVRR